LLRYLFDKKGKKKRLSRAYYHGPVQSAVDHLQLHHLAPARPANWFRHDALCLEQRLRSVESQSEHGQRLKEHPDLLRTIHWRTFEKLLADLLERSGATGIAPEIAVQSFGKLL
jgi:hypothetical protein